MPAVIGRAPQCPACKVPDIGIVKAPKGEDGGRVIAHTPGHGSVLPAKKRCPGSGAKMKMQAPPRKPAGTNPAAKLLARYTASEGLMAIRKAHGQVTELSAKQGLASIASIIEAVAERVVNAAASETAVLAPIRHEMTDLEMHTIYEIATGTLVMPEAAS